MQQPDASTSTTTVLQRVRRFLPVAILLALAAAAIWYKEAKQAAREAIADLDAHYHHRNAGEALIQIAPAPVPQAAGDFRYLATFENRSDDPLIITGVQYDVHQPFEVRPSDTNNSNASMAASAEAEPLGVSTTYKVAVRCKHGLSAPLVPPFKISAHAIGTFEVKIKRGAHPGVGCPLKISFATNQGSTNGRVPEIDD